ncbi:MAG: 2Fe-2S iron-sulfur cluster-binding protein [Candidatus Aminicenantales bacterium]|jgi:NADH-quinone oxidoreductase subunit G
MVTIQIDGKPLQVAPGTTVLKAAEQMGIVIPRFCFHPAFEPEGSCRMCLVEIEGLPKLDLACSTVVREGMIVRTSTPKVIQARKDVLEFFLADHPLDCPICDKAGECFLQDYYDKHGRYASRFLEAKEKKKKKIPIGKKLILDRERCVLCTRCVRFLRRVTGTGELGVFERGVTAEIGIDEGTEIKNNYSGNLVDICPVGAITDGDFRFKTRAWFLEKKRTVCPRCSRGCNIVIQSVRDYPLSGRQRKIYRIVAAENPDVNGHWICDYGRYGYPDVEDNRWKVIAVNRGEPAGGRPPNWENILKGLAAEIRGLADAGRTSSLAVILNSFLTNEELAACRKLFADALGVRSIFFADPKPGEADGHLLTADRAPNGGGAAALGFLPTLPDLDRLAGASDLLIAFGPHLLDHFPVEKLAAALQGIGRKYLLASHRSALDALADIILPTAHPAEKKGSFTNIKGTVQPFECAVKPPRGSLPEGEILSRLASELGVKLE